MKARDTVLAAAVLAVASSAAAQAPDPAAARARFQQGFSLKQQGRCKEAIGYFLDGLRLDPQPNALLDLAECEERIGKLGAAATHFVEARDLARWQGLDAERARAEQRLSAIDHRVARLIIRLRPDSPLGTTVARDGVDLPSTWLNAPLPSDAGKHVISATGGGFQQSYEISIADGETKDVVVTPVGGAPVAMTAPSPAWTRALGPSTEMALAGPRAAPPQDDGSPGNGQRIAGFALMGGGVVGLAIGSVFGLKVTEKNREIDSICPTGQPCPPSSVLAYNHAVAEAKIDRAASLVSFGVGAIFVGTGAALVLTAPKRRTSPIAVWFSPSLGSSGPGAALGGIW